MQDRKGQKKGERGRMCSCLVSQEANRPADTEQVGEGTSRMSSAPPITTPNVLQAALMEMGMGSSKRRHFIYSRVPAMPLTTRKDMVGGFRNWSIELLQMEKLMHGRRRKCPCLPNESLTMSQAMEELRERRGRQLSRSPCSVPIKLPSKKGCGCCPLMSNPFIAVLSQRTKVECHSCPRPPTPAQTKSVREKSCKRRPPRPISVSVTLTGMKVVGERRQRLHEKRYKTWLAFLLSRATRQWECQLKRRI
jgi:hypothetical protein